jgi:hypothetical protein
MPTLAEVKRIPTDEEIFAWESPATYLGMPVSFYRSGVQEDGKQPEFGFVVRPTSSTKKTVDISLPASGQIVTSVRHASDLKLLKNPNTRENGIWDYTSERTAIYERLEKIEAALAAVGVSTEGASDGRLEKLESAVHGLKIKVSRLSNAAKDTDEGEKGE